MNQALLPRALGVLTAAYGTYALLRPTSVARQLHTDRPRTAVRASRAIGVRDVLSGAAMVAAPAGAMLNTAVAARVAADTSDALFLSRLSADPARRNLVRAVALGWGAACAAAGVWAARQESPR